MKLRNPPRNTDAPERLSCLMDEMDKAIVDVKSLLNRLSARLDRDQGNSPNA